tara:strand:- start:69 stop:488 length:420 start_codon:yes stop_codon:yes gene_type:complete
MVADRTVRGQVVAGAVARISLFDGKFDTGYRIKSLTIAPKDISTDEEIWCRLLTSKQNHGTTWDWQSNTQVGWAAWNVPTNSRFSQFGIVNKEAIIVEDLYIDMSGDSGEEINYMIELEYIEFSDWKGALAMVQNRAQG